MPPDEYPVYAPVIIVEVLSPSNTPAKISRQRIVAMSAGTQEFWVVDAERRTVLVTNLSGANVYAPGDNIPLPMFGAVLAVDQIFA
jgi:Uma2 family endonuclease